MPNDVAPSVSNNFIRSTLLEYYGLECDTISQLPGYTDKNYLLRGVRSVNDPADDNPLLINGCVFKITSAFEAQKEGLIEAQIDLLNHANRNGIPSTKIIAMKNGRLTNTVLIERKGVKLPIRLFEFINGVEMKTIILDEKKVLEIGKLVSAFVSAMKSYNNAILTADKVTWSYLHMQDIALLANIFNDVEKCTKIKNIVDEFLLAMSVTADKLPFQIIHSDISEGNVLFDADTGKVTALLDFSDSHLAPRVFEVSNCVLYCMLECFKPGCQVDAYKAFAIIIRHFQNTVNEPLTHTELSMLRIAMLARLAMSMTYGYHYYLKNPSNATYVLYSEKNGWKLLDSLLTYSDCSLINLIDSN